MSPFYSKAFVRLAELSKADQRILQAISSEPLRIADIQKATRLSWSTTRFRILRLEKKGLLRSERHGRRLWYSPLPEAEIIASTGGSGVTVYRGVTEMIALWRKIVSLPKNSRITVLQPHRSFQLALQKSPKAAAIEISRQIKERRFVIDGIGHEQYVRIITSIYGRSVATQDLARAFVGRLEDIVKVPDDFIDEEAEMFLYQDHIVFMDWNSETSMDIYNPALYRLMRSVCEKVKAHGSRHHFGEEIERRLGK